MILWINGAFGAGKTQTAAELHRRIPDSFVYDPENVGYWLRKNEPKALQADNFQDEPLWRSVNRDMLLHLAAHYDGVILVPMTLVQPQYYWEIICPIRDQGFQVQHFLLYPSLETVKRRLARRGDRGNTWALAQFSRCCRAFEDPIFENRIVNDSLSIAETAEAIAQAAGIPLTPRLGRLRTFTCRAKTFFQHIRR